MPLPSRRARQQASPSSSLPTSLAAQTVQAQVRQAGMSGAIQRPGFVVPRKTTKHYLASPAAERSELDQLENAEVTGASARSPSGLSLAIAALERQRGEMAENQKPAPAEVPLAELIGASKGKGKGGRPPRATVAQTLGYDFVRPEAISQDEASQSANQPAASTSTPRAFSLLRTLMHPFVGRTPDLSRSVDSAPHDEVQANPHDAESPAQATPSHSVIALDTAPPAWEPWVGIEDQNDEDLLFWDDIDQDPAPEAKGKVTKPAETLTYARAVLKD